MMTEGREVDPDQITQHVVHPALHQDYASDFRSRRVTDIAPTLTSLILVGIASSMHLPEGPTMPEGPETPKAQEGLQGGGEAPVQPAIPGPSHIDEPMETEEEKPLGALPINLNATILTNLPKDPADVIILDDNEPSFTDSYPEAISTPIVELASDRKVIIGGDKSQHISSEEAGHRRNGGPAFPSGISSKGDDGERPPPQET